MHIFLTLLFTGLKSISFVTGISGSTNERYCQIKNDHRIHIFPLFAYQKHKNRTAGSRQGVVK